MLFAGLHKHTLTAHTHTRRVKFDRDWPRFTNSAHKRCFISSNVSLPLCTDHMLHTCCGCMRWQQQQQQWAFYFSLHRMHNIFSTQTQLSVSLLHIFSYLLATKLPASLMVINPIISLHQLLNCLITHIHLINIDQWGFKVILSLILSPGVEFPSN